ncbi:thiol-disulfide oxidoreductase DCC family protein [Bacillus sp. S/N-304-OC-R1]|uniref:thiol-disulfide oxidoreductase DCC family protein n=1 Tax=Bacillus sp. S/N-304-OC-R1 TaxID=2758034 RepID=UPI001C8DCA51|nr:DUF393 domain-containing protein [Bacillus sp. S/N-304-OC-R1]MBY0124180.1 DUF393 domain-containing protein [Bacillus sp. S/N-304-OC-R1]
MKTTALYDETCSLCKESKQIFKKIDWLRKIEWVSLQDYERKNQLISFDRTSLRRELHIITSNGKVLKGYNAVRHLLLLSPPASLFGFFLYIPGMSFLGDPLYKWIAKNRHKFLRKKCDNGSCSL